VERSFHNGAKKEIVSIQDRKPGLRRLFHHLSQRSGFDHHHGPLHHRREKARQRMRIFIALKGPSADEALPSRTRTVVAVFTG
jgi:hypothetical protein